MHRPSGRTFGASYVFPGGVVEPDDREAARFSALPADAANRSLGLAEGGLEFYCAAVRELFEEAGVLLARTGDGKAPPPRALAAARVGLNDGTLRWSEFLEDNGLVLATDALHYLAWWITPRARPKRYSTRFFLTALPEGQEASHDGRELTDSRWMTASDAVDAARAGELRLPPPTLTTLADLAPCERLEDLLAWAARRAREGVPRILPAIVRRDGRDRILLPGDPDYPPDADMGET